MNTFLLILSGVSMLLIGLGLGKTQTWQSRLRFMLIPISVVASIAFIFFIIGCWKINQLGEFFEANFTSIYQLQILPLFVIEYILLASIAIFFVAWKKQGFSNFKKKKGLITKFIGMLIAGFIWGLFLLLIDEGLILVFIIPLFITYMTGLVWGLLNENK